MTKNSNLASVEHLERTSAMESTKQQNKDSLGTLLKWGLGGLVVWELLPPDAKNDVVHFINELGKAFAEHQRRKAEIEKQERLRQELALIFLKMPVQSNAPKLTQIELTKPIIPLADPDNNSRQNVSVPESDVTFNLTQIEPDSIWLEKIIHPSVILILGKRGSGKSATAYHLLELFRYSSQPYVVGVPASKRHLLPEWIGIASSLEEVPSGAIAIIDEAYIRYHARNSSAQESLAMSKELNLSRQKEQTLIFVTQESRQIDKNIASSANVIIFKDMGMLQLEFERPELSKLAVKAKDAFATVTGDKHRWNYLYSPDTDFTGLIENNLPSFWKPSLSRIFSGETTTITKSRAAQKLTHTEKKLKAREIRATGASYGQIARMLGVTRSTVLNYLRNYPYNKAQN